MEDYNISIRIWKFIAWFLIIIFLFLTSGYIIRKLIYNGTTISSSGIDSDKVQQIQSEIEKIQEQTETNDKYYTNVRKILNGETPELDQEPIKIEGEQIYAPDSIKSKNQEPTTTLPTENIENGKSTQNISNKYKVEDTYKFYFTPLRGILTHGFLPEKNHFAVDIAAKEGEPIKSIADGVVLFADWTSSTGYVVMIQHPNNVITVYKHNSQVYKKMGDKVKMGEVIAAVGNTGELTTGPHLHFEIWVNGQPDNPQKYINF